MFRQVLVASSAVVALSTVAAAEIIGPWDIVEAPDSAVLIAGGGDSFGWTHVVNAPITFEEAFTGFGIIDDGYANADEGTTIEVGFSGGVINSAGPDVVLFDAHFDFGEYTIATDFDGFVFSLAVAGWIDTGEARGYYYEFNDLENPADVWGAEIDLSDLGVPDGVMVSAFRFTTTNGSGDPLGLGVIPGPATASILLAGLLVGRRRRRRGA